MNLAPATLRPAERSGAVRPAPRPLLPDGARTSRRFGYLIGPAFVAAIAFVDPGNVATNITAGADYRYQLLWTVVAASAIATLVQYLSAKLGMATGTSLAEVCREHTSAPVRVGLWLIAELVVITTDLAEFVGGAVALTLIFGVSPLAGGVVIAAVSVLVMQLRMRGRAVFPAVVIGLLFAIALGFGYLIAATPFAPTAAAGGLLPRLGDRQAALLACGIVGATVMPHAIFLHSSLTGDLGGRVRPLRTAAMLRFLRRDVLIAMSLAGLVNALILLVGTQLPAGAGDSLVAAHAVFARDRGQLFAMVFAVALLASGLASSCAGIYSGQAIMQGFLRRGSSIWLRRLISAVPALVVLAVIGNATQALVISQVALAFGLPFALLPLLVFTARRSIMGRFTNRAPTTVLAAAATGVVITLNVVVLNQAFG